METILIRKNHTDNVLVRFTQQGLDYIESGNLNNPYLVLKPIFRGKELIKFL